MRTPRAEVPLLREERRTKPGGCFFDEPRDRRFVGSSSLDALAELASCSGVKGGGGGQRELRKFKAG